MRIARLTRGWLFTIALALVSPASADEPEGSADPQTSPSLPSRSSAVRDEVRSAGPRGADIGDSNRVHFRSPIHVLSHLQVNVQITIGAPPDNPWPPAAGGTRPPVQHAPPATQGTGPADRDADSAAARLQTPQQRRRRFRRLDTDGDGRLSRDELQSRLPARRAARWIDTLDADGDDRLSLEELSTTGGARTQRSSPGT